MVLIFRSPLLNIQSIFNGCLLDCCLSFQPLEVGSKIWRHPSCLVFHIHEHCCHVWIECIWRVQHTMLSQEYIRLKVERLRKPWFFLTRKHLFILFLVFVEKCVYCLLHWRHYLCNTCCVTHISSHISYLLRMQIQTQLYIIYDIIVVNTCFAINYINLFSVYKQFNRTFDFSLSTICSSS